jgi:hypothetical protein
MSIDTTFDGRSELQGCKGLLETSLGPVLKEIASGCNCLKPINLHLSIFFNKLKTKI